MSRPVALGPAHVATRLIAAMRTLAVALRRRRVLTQIGAMNDHMLRDIGLTRQDLCSAAAEPLFRDPTVGLAARARATRRDAWDAARRKAALSNLRALWEADRRAA